MLQLKDIKKDYITAGSTVHALRGVSLRFRQNEFVSILGQSGCGKTTLLNIIGGLDHYTSGDLVICGKSTKDYKDKDWDVYRNHRIGFVFQSYNLIPHQTVLSNVELALTIAGVSKEERRRRAKEALCKVGLGAELHKRPNQLSGGQMQRVAIARALVNNPEILLADEPTGALDSATSVQIMELIREIAGERLVIMVTHNPEIAEEYSTRIVRLQDGLVVSDTNPYDGEGSESYTDKPVALEKKDEVKEEKPLKKQKKERSSMSFLTSLGLSANNLMTKKGRTAITSVAGSIGIISVCLVLALSNGFNSYILKTQEDMLASSPVKITRSSMDPDAIISNFTAAKEMPDLSKIGDEVYVNSFLSGLAQGLMVTNDLNEEYITYLESMSKDAYTAIQYDYGENLLDKIFTSVDTGGVTDNEGNTSTAKTEYMSLTSLKAYFKNQLAKADSKYAEMSYLVDFLSPVVNKMPGTSELTNGKFPNSDYILSQYDIVAGEFPKASNEVVLVVGGSNDVSDLTLAQLGFISEEKFLDLFQTHQSGEEIEMTIPFDDIMNEKFVLYDNDSIYQKNEVAMSPTYAQSYKYNYVGNKSALTVDTEANKGVELKVSGVLRLKKGHNYGCLNSGLNVTEKLVEEYIERNKTSEIAKAITEGGQNLTDGVTSIPGAGNVPAGMKFFVQRVIAGFDDYYIEYKNPQTDMTMGWILYTDLPLLQSLGVTDEVAGISIYTDSFEAKNQVLSHLDQWNDDHTADELKGKQVRYTDTIGMMMTMVETILDAITYVLVAFTAISLVVSSVMIGIITYVSVVERTKEIGVLRSLGARKSDIKNLFNAETFIIGLTSGVFGVGVTYGLSAVVNAIMNALTGIATLASLPVASAIVMICVSFTLTLISGLIPARAAAKKDPVIALRTE